MDPTTFTERKTGELVRITEGGVAFLPGALPIPHFALSPEIILALEEATLELGRLDGHGQNLPDPHLLVAPFLRKEAVLSSRIEGTQTTFSDLVLFEAAQVEHAARQRDNREVANYVSALYYAIDRCAILPIGKRFVCEIHGQLMAGIDEGRTQPGRFRETQVHIAQPGVPLADARFVPPPAYHVEAAFDNLRKYIAEPDSLPLLVRLAIVHYQFEAIHPFLDGNGRLGRLLIVLMLCAERRLAAPMLYMSAYFERRRSQYNDLMLNVSRDGQWDPWILFFLRGVAIQARDAVRRTRQLQNLRAKYKERLGGATAAARDLVDELFKLPVMTHAIAMRVTGFTWQSARDTVRRLEGSGIIMRLAGERKQHVYVAHEIIRIVDAAEAAPSPVDSREVTQPSADASEYVI